MAPKSDRQVCNDARVIVKILRKSKYCAGCPNVYFSGLVGQRIQV